MSEELKALLRAQAVEIAEEGHLGWGNTMVCAAAAIDERDARIAELESDSRIYAECNEALRAELADVTQADAHYQAEALRLAAELAAIKAQEPVAFVHPEQLKVLSAESSATCAVWNKPGAMPSGTSLRVPLYAEPVSEAKAQGVVMPERLDIPHRDEFESSDQYAAAVGESKKWNACLDEVARLNAAPVQQVSVPDELDRAFITGESCDGEYRVVIQSETLKEMHAVHRWLASLNASPAAPAADAGVNSHD